MRTPPRPTLAQLRHRVAVARGDEPADLVLHGGRVLDVFTAELLATDVAVADGHIAGLGDYDGAERVDVTGQVVIPGLIDGHMHLESTKLTVDAFAATVLPHGTTTVVVDPHEIANVFGPAGVRALLAAGPGLPLDVCMMVPSCVPASRYESAAATVDADGVAALLDEPAALGLAEVMDVPGVVAGRPDVLAKLVATALAGGHADGHAPGLSGAQLNAYVAAGIRSDHECTDAAEALEKRRLGMWVMLREGSVARDLEALLPLVERYGPAQCLLCTDDVEPTDLVRRGHMDAVLRRAVTLGCDPVAAVTMATLNPARYHHLDDRGAVAPGLRGDLVVVGDLTGFEVSLVLAQGRVIARNGACADLPHPPVPASLRESVHLAPVRAEHLRIPAGSGQVRVVGVRPGDLVTDALVRVPTVRDGAVVADPGRDLSKLAVVERHVASGRVGVGLVTGFGLRRGALASTVAHDAHNLVVVGVDDDDMLLAVRRLAELGGGQVVTAGARVLAELPLPLGGLLSDQPAPVVAAAADRLEAAAGIVGVGCRAPFMTLSFLALTVIPALKMTDHGLFDVTGCELVPTALP